MRSVLLFLIILLMHSIAQAQDKPVAIDGDTFKEKGKYYRLYNVDTPEKGELYYKYSKEMLQSWLDTYGTLYECKAMGKGKYGRHLLKCPALEYKLYSAIPNAKWYDK